MDRALTLLVTLWALASIVPVAAWTGVAEIGYLEAPWALWSRTLLVAFLASALALVATRGRVTTGLRTALGWVLAVPRARFLTALGVLASLEAIAVSITVFGRSPTIIDAW